MGVVWVGLDWTRPDQSGSIPWAAAGSLSGHGGLSFPIEGNEELMREIFSSLSFALC